MLWEKGWIISGRTRRERKKKKKKHFRTKFSSQFSSLWAFLSSAHRIYFHFSFSSFHFFFPFLFMRRKTFFCVGKILFFLRWEENFLHFALGTASMRDWRDMIQRVDRTINHLGFLKLPYPFILLYILNIKERIHSSNSKKNLIAHCRLLIARN